MNISKHYQMDDSDNTSVRLKQFPTNARVLGTDLGGNPKENVNSILSKYASTMEPAVATAVMVPSLVGTRSEICSTLIPIVNTKVNIGTIFKCAIVQGGTGTIVLTLRDSDLHLIASSEVITNPNNNTSLSANVNSLVDPDTNEEIEEYELISGVLYYLGINYSTSGSSFVGVVSSQSVNIIEISSKKFDNLTSTPDTLTGGTETLMRPYVSITSEV